MGTVACSGCTRKQYNFGYCPYLRPEIECEDVLALMVATYEQYANQGVEEIANVPEYQQTPGGVTLSLTEFLDIGIRNWRKRKYETRSHTGSTAYRDRKKAEHYIDAYQCVRLFVEGKELPEDE
jgi:hypothetical protein